jgi:hypothetical protein
MKWYSLTITLDDDDNLYFADESSICGIHYFDLKLGKRVTSWNPKSFFRSTSPNYDGELTGILGEHLGVPTFSPQLREALDRANVATNDIQYLPVQIFKSTNEKVEGFSIANVVSRVQALNYESSTMLEQDASRIDPLTGQAKVVSVWTPALWEKPLRGHDVIRLVEYFPYVLVSERFADVFWEGGFTAAVLEPLTVCD